MIASSKNIALGITMVALLGAGCASHAKFQPVTEIPPGHGLVYIYATPETALAPSRLSHDGRDLASLGPDEYLVHFPSPGTNSYGFQMNFFSRGGLIGQLVTHTDPEATRLRIEPGKTYYLRLIGFGLGASLWRVDESSALADMEQCHPVKIEKSERQEANRPQ